MILIATISLLAIYLAANILKQLWRNKQGIQFFHKLSKNLPLLPNPNIVLGNVIETIWNPKNYKQMWELHQKYGKTFGFYICTAQPWVATCDLDLIKLVMIEQGDKHTDRMKLNAPYKEFNESIFQANGDTWRAARRALAPSLTNHKVRSTLISSDIDDVVAQLRAFLSLQSQKAAAKGESSFIVDTMHISKRYALAAIILVTYKKNGVVDFQSDRDKWVDELENMSRAACNPICLVGMAFPFLEQVNNFLLHTTTHLYKQVNTIVNFIDHALDPNAVDTRQSEEERASGKRRRRIADEIIETYLAKKLGIESLKATLLLFILAGFDTTAGTINHIIWQLAWNSDIQDKLRKSIINGGGFDSEYLHWCIMEGMRTHPSVPLGYGRVLTSDIHHKGMVIPKGTHLTPSPWTVHNDPEVWPEPEKYKPERWAKSEEFHPAAWLGFGLGARNCIGAKLAMQEMKLMFQMLLTNYRIEPCAESPKQFNFSSPAMFNTQTDDPMIFRFVPLAAVSV